MTRSISAPNESASQAATIYPVYFVKLQFDTGDVCLHTGLGSISFGGDTYTGTGAIGSIGGVDEDADLSRTTLELTLRGLPTDLVSVTLNEYYQGRRATLYGGYLDATSQQLVDTPFILYRGRMDTAAVEQEETVSIRLTVESRFAAWDRPLTRRYNGADQQLRYPGDRGLEYVEQTTEKPLFWGQKAPA
ncbi:hypothetical protein J8F10_24055 [Gemmata sp. G18]|uniref:Uncharacterized protein n=1 Tax=Gemmata palustris TaxID=2822762 RepID=A0ABS5BX95_9BACT|nr:hypothetical protein [Gemmata palustris]MBP3958334.1 hypothetical protein [Gemmata palustris]